MTDEEQIKRTGFRPGSTSSSGFIRLKIPDSDVMNSLQIGVQHTVGAQDLEPERDLLFQDFMTFQSLTFPTKGSNTAPPHSFVSFKFLNYAPIAFKCFRGLFKIKTENFLNSMCSASLRQLENPGASGSIFYLTYDDAFILKTVQQREAEFLLKLLPGYYLNLTQNPRTLLPKFFGFYCYSCLNRNIRIVVMNNLVPSNISVSQKYDLKGSTSKRKATQVELRKSSPTYKDLDFLEHHPEGLFLDYDTYNALTHALERDCRVLESFKIIDYSLLLAVHYVDRKSNVKKFTCTPDGNKEPTRGIPATTPSGEELLLFIGIIDVLQSYQFRKRVEHTVKSLIYEKDSISVHRPDFYSQRFQNFLVKRVFQPVGKKKLSFTKTPRESEPSCSASKLLEESSLTLAWASSKAKYSRKLPQAFLSDENLKRRSPKVSQLMCDEAEEERKIEGETEGKMEGKTKKKIEGKMNGKTEGKIEEKMEGKMDEKMRRKINGKKNGKMDVKVEGETEGKMEAEMEEKMEGKTKRKIEGKMNGKTEGKIEEKMERKMEGETEGKMEAEMEEKMEGKTKKEIKGKMNGKTEGKIEEKMEGKMEGEVDEKMERKINGKKNGKMDGKMEGETDGKEMQSLKPIVDEVKENDIELNAAIVSLEIN